MNLVKSNWFLLILLSAIWGGAFTLNKMALDTFTPEVIVAGRLISGSVFLVALIYFLYKRFSINLAQVNYYLFMSLVGIVIPFIAINLCLFISVNYEIFDNTFFTVDQIGRSGPTFPPSPYIM